jgi:hypothetical protein
MEWLSPGCLVGSVLSAAALLADPDSAPQRVAVRAREQLADLETLGRVAMVLDTGPAPLRWLLGLRPARDVARDILGDGAAGIERELAAVAPWLPALRAARRPAAPGAASLTDAVATRVVEAIRGPDRTVPPEATGVLVHLERIPDAVGRARLRLVVLVLGLGGFRWLECLGLGFMVRTWIRRRIPAPSPPNARSLAPAGVATKDRRAGRRARAPADTIGETLAAAGVHESLASEIAQHFARAPDWPGSLRGHDAEPGGLRQHTVRVLTRMADASAGWPPETRSAAAVVAAAHDLGKLVAYQRVGPGRWVGTATTPHDCLSAILLTRCPSWPAFGSAETRAAILHAVASQHAPEGLPANAPPLARQLLATLAEADAAAAREASGTPSGTEETASGAA